MTMSWFGRKDINDVAIFESCIEIFFHVKHFLIGSYL